MFVTKRNGQIENVFFDKITIRIKKLVKPDERDIIDPIMIAQKVVASIYPGITTEELDNESAKICVNLCTIHHSYSMLAGRLVVSNLHKKTLNTFVEKEILIQKELGFLDLNWIKWIQENKDELNNIIDYNRDYMFDYFGFKTLEQGYLIRNGSVIIERPQDMFLRVASFINMGNLKMVKKTYDMISKGYYTHATPTLFNCGNIKSQLSSCFLVGTNDSLEGITKTWADISKISKWGGGVGLHISNIRAKGSLIRGTNGPSSGVIPMLKVYNEIARYIDQCFVGSTKVYTEKGLIPIEEIKTGNQIFTIDGTLQKVERVYCDNYNGTVLNLKLFNDCEPVQVTPGHPFYVIKNDNNDTCFKTIINKLERKIIAPDWISIEYTNINDFIGFPIPKNIIDNRNIDDADCYIYGLVLCDGSIDKDNNVFSINTLEYNEDVTLIIKKYLDTNGIIYSTNNSVIFWEVTSKFKFVRSQFYDNNNNKCLDQSMLFLPEDKAKWIIKAALDVNGVIEHNIILNATQGIVDGIKYILLQMGILCDSDWLSIRNNIKSSNQLIIPKVKKITDLMQIKHITPINDYGYFTFNDVIYTKVKDKTEENITTSVYDLEIVNNHNYLTQVGLVHNGGKRKGSISIYLEPHHPDILSFLDLRKNFGTETERARDLFLALWISDLFMKQVENNGDWYLMCPDKCPNLSDTYGDAYENLYWTYVNKKLYNTKIKARDLMKVIIDTQIETGMPYITFKDHINKKSNQKNIGTIKSSNLCAEIVQYSDDKEYAVCNLSSIAICKFVKPFKSSEKWTIYTKSNCNYCEWAKYNMRINSYEYEEKSVDQQEDTVKQLCDLIGSCTLTYPQIFYNDKHIGGYSEYFKFTCGTFNYDELYSVAYFATINLNSIIDINYYPVPEAKCSNIKHRPIGLGVQGVVDALVLLKIRFESDEATTFNAKIMETIYLAAVTASTDISMKRYPEMNQLIDIFESNNTIFPEYYDKTYILNDDIINKMYHNIKPSIFELKNKKSMSSGSYSTFQGSPISNGLFQFDLWSYDSDKLHYKDKWIKLRHKVKIYGVRNSLLTALMPTASTSQILGNNECFESFTNNIYTRKTMAGDFPLVNKYLINDLSSIGLWNNEMKQLILANNGSIAKFNNIPESIRKLYPTIWEVKQIWVLKNAVARGPFVDQSQSMNIFMAVPDSQKIFSSHFWAWKNGLKTGIYYLRSKASKDANQVTIDPLIKDKLIIITQPEHQECISCSG